MSETERLLREAVAAIDLAGGCPTHVVIPPENVDLALALGLEVEIHAASPARHPIPRDEWNLARYLAKRGGLRAHEHVVHMRPGKTVIEAGP